MIVLWILGGLVVAAVVTLAFGAFLRYERRRNSRRPGYMRPDPSNLIPDRATRELHEERERWRNDPANKGLTPPWLKTPLRKDQKPETD